VIVRPTGGRPDGASGGYETIDYLDIDVRSRLLVERGELDPTRVITHRLPLSEAAHGYEIFKHKQDHCEKVVLKP
jgi:hypothetical protein